MPHNVPEEKEWLHLRDAICLGDVDAIIDELWSIRVGESVQEIDPETGMLTGKITHRAIPYEDMQDILKAEKLQVGRNACAVVDKSTFQEYTNHLITQVMNIYQPEEMQIDSYKESMDSGRWDKVFNDMVGRASGRIEAGPSHYKAGERTAHRDSHHYVSFSSDAGVIKMRQGRSGARPSHYTDKTPEGALEAMERRLGGGFSQQMVDALAQMELKVGELAEAVRLMGSSVPAPIVAVVAEVEEAVEGAQEALEGRALSVVRAKAIREHIVGLGASASEENPRSVAAALQGSLPGVTERDVANAIQRWPGGSPLGRSPTIRKPQESTSLEDRMQSGYQKPERHTRYWARRPKGASWSRDYFDPQHQRVQKSNIHSGRRSPRLGWNPFTEEQHDIMDEEFDKALSQLSDDQLLYVPSLPPYGMADTAFDKNGREVQLPGEPLSGHEDWDIHGLFQFGPVRDPSIPVYEGPAGPWYLIPKP
jgi:hypothetical protein